MDENNQSLFEEKLNELVKLGHKKKNVVDNNDIQDVFADIELSEENHERIYETLEQNNIDILTITEDDNLLP
ncbi:MAG: RNA polymerase sigma factor region1.1 domain-containing protein, partial [Lachnospiraceae bacterium]|nr:RNA polymerase sigma factor region1.1 domain-containing protein [Lachnospiraceae bacterium]